MYAFAGSKYWCFYSTLLLPSSQTEAKPLLVAVNPFKDLGNATNSVIHQYRDAIDVEKLPPHVFAIARAALENLHS